MLRRQILLDYNQWLQYTRLCCIHVPSNAETLSKANINNPKPNVRANLRTNNIATYGETNS